ncbi:hypothetical protein HDK77DRAFT_280634 [Phyllosticta capitalensis]|uniref:Uncharacterized protein n=1 Tax=Phyllosticta capitalensis TaxID=121624 RepID=A0ABR1YGK5_9PEZI
MRASAGHARGTWKGWWCCSKVLSVCRKGHVRFRRVVKGSPLQQSTSEHWTFPTGQLQDSSEAFVISRLSEATRRLVAARRRRSACMRSSASSILRCVSVIMSWTRQRLETMRSLKPTALRISGHTRRRGNTARLSHTCFLMASFSRSISAMKSSDSRWHASQPCTVAASFSSASWKRAAVFCFSRSSSRNSLSWFSRLARVVRRPSVLPRLAAAFAERAIGPRSGQRVRVLIAGIPGSSCPVLEDE